METLRKHRRGAPPGFFRVEAAGLAWLADAGAVRVARVLAAYAEASEHLPDRWRDLVPLHQVHPLLVHAVLFGGGYVAQAERAASEALSLP